MTSQNIRSRITQCAVTSMAALLLTAPAAWADMIQPGTAQATQTIATLRHAAKIDEDNAAAHTAEDRDVGIYYHNKAKTARVLADQLAGGQAIDSGDVAHALSTKGAVKLSPSY